MAMSDRDFWEAVDRRRAAGEKVDVHTFRASWESGVPENEITPTQRGAAKCLNYAHLYIRPIDWIGTIKPGPAPSRNRLDEMYARMRAISDRYGEGRALKDILTEDRYVAPEYPDFSEIEKRIMARGQSPIATAATASMRCLKERGLSPTGRFLEDPLDFGQHYVRPGWNFGSRYYGNAFDLEIAPEGKAEAVKLGRDGKPVKPEPYYRTQEKKRGKQY
jgi:hypothetical protein